MRILPLLALPLLLVACAKPAPPVQQAPANGIEFGTLFDGTRLVVGEGDLAGKGVVVNFFGVG